MDSLGRRGGLALGMLIGATGAATAVYAIGAGSLPGFLVGLALMGVGHAAIVLGRFAAGEVYPPAARGRAIANVVLGGTVGAIVGPFLVTVAGPPAIALGLEEVSGSYASSVLLFGAAALIMFVFLRPDPRDLGRLVAQAYPHPNQTLNGMRTLRQILALPAARVAMTAMALSQVAMTMLMVITGVHYRNTGHAMGDVSLVISSHTLGMYAFSVMSGRLCDLWGRGPVIAAGATALALSALTAPLSHELLPYGASLFLLGLGWNFCFVGGSTLLADQLAPAERARTQGFNDLLVGLSAATASLSSGLLYGQAGFGAAGLVAAVLSLAVLSSVAWWMRRQPGPTGDA
jgi:MFS family permease